MGPLVEAHCKQHFFGFFWLTATLARNCPQHIALPPLVSVRTRPSLKFLFISSEHMERACALSAGWPSVLSRRKLLFVSAIKQIAAQWFQLTSKSSFAGSNSYIRTWNVLFRLCSEALQTIMSLVRSGFSLLFFFFFFGWLFPVPHTSPSLTCPFEAAPTSPMRSPRRSTRAPVWLTPGGLLVTRHKKWQYNGDKGD